MSITHDDRIAYLKQKFALAEQARESDHQSQNSAVAPVDSSVLSHCDDGDGLDLGSELGFIDIVPVQQPVSASPMSSVVSSATEGGLLAKSGASSKKKVGNAACKDLHRKDWWQVESRASDLLLQVMFKLLNCLS